MTGRDIFVLASVNAFGVMYAATLLPEFLGFPCWFLAGVFACIAVFAHFRINIDNRVSWLCKRDLRARKTIKDLAFEMRVLAEQNNRLRYKLGHSPRQLPMVKDVDEIGKYLG